MANETIATYEHDGKIYEIDNLGLAADFDQWGQFAVYQDGDQVAGFAIAEDGQQIPLEFAVMRGSPEPAPAELPATTEALIEMAKRAVAEG
jgi:hypothetical protein